MMLSKNSGSRPDDRAQTIRTAATAATGGTAGTGGAVRLSTGTLYGLIKRFLDDELIVELAVEDDGQERRRPYKLTPFGREVAAAEAARLQKLVTAARAVRLLPH